MTGKFTIVKSVKSNNVIQGFSPGSNCCPDEMTALSFCISDVAPQLQIVDLISTV
jgi:hypothetical protein